MAKKIALLGSTGSIGRQSLDVAHKLEYEVTALCACRSVDLLEEQVRRFHPKLVGVVNEAAGQKLRARLANMVGAPRLVTGLDAPHQLAALADADMVLNAIVGIAGLAATLAALARGVNVALANKESLVAGGVLVTREMQKTGAKLLPVDSEHSAIFQCLQDPQASKSLAKILLTASGGPFYGKTAAQLADVTKQQALAHPNWSMGPKISIDSATMMNKGLELIEAMWLFGLPASGIEIVVQRESIIHSMVQFRDHSVLAQLGVPDMRLPIQYALTWPQRLPCPAPELDFGALTGLQLGRADEETFRCLAACRKAAEKGGLAPCAANGAGEEAVALFLREEIRFLDIGSLVEGCVDADNYSGGYDLDDVYACDAQARAYVRERV